MYARARVRREMGVEEVDFYDLAGLLVSHDRMPPTKAKLMAKRFRRSFGQPDCWRWLSTRALNSDELMVMKGLLDLYGADDLSLWRGKLGPSSWVRPQTDFVLHFSRERANAVSYRGVLKLAVFGKIIELRTVGKAMLVMGALALWSALGVALAWGLLLWGLATVALFIYSPGYTTIAATREGRIGLGLLAALIGIAAIGGKLLRRIFRRH